MKLSALFESCLSASYLSTENGGDYAVEKKDGTVYIYLESSDGIEDWKNNLSFERMPYEREGKTAFYAHAGFLRVFLSILPHIEAEIAHPENCRFTVVGFSHGGALAVLLHEHILYRRPELLGRVEGYGFGTPRVLTFPWRRAWRECFANFTVIRNGNDAVTHLPPRALGYYHVGRLLEIGSPDAYSSIDAHRPENILKELYLWERKNAEK